MESEQIKTIDKCMTDIHELSETIHSIVKSIHSDIKICYVDCDEDHTQGR